MKIVYQLIKRLFKKLLFPQSTLMVMDIPFFPTPFHHQFTPTVATPPTTPIHSLSPQSINHIIAKKPVYYTSTLLSLSNFILSIGQLSNLVYLFICLL